MTEKLKLQSFNQILPFASAILLLALLFNFSIFFNHGFFLILSVGLFVLIIILFLMMERSSKRQSMVALHLEETREQRNLMEEDIKKENQAIDSLKEKMSHYMELRRYTENLGTCLNLEDTSKVILEEVNKLFGDEQSTIILYGFESMTGELGLSLSQKGQMRVNLKAKKGDLFDHYVVKTMQPLLVEDAGNDFRFDIAKVYPEDNRVISSLISVPLIVGKKTLGILRIDHPSEKEYETEDLRYLTTIGDLGAVAIENAQLYESLQELAIKDGLTGLYLRRYLWDRLNEETARHIRHKSSMSLLMIDLDYFKKYNDEYGHSAGDIVLKTVAEVLSKTFVLPGDIVCRYGGEEFCVLLPDCSKAKALKLAEELRKNISEQVILLRRVKTHVTLSVGVATFPEDASAKEELIHKADQALYLAKTNGRNKVCEA